VCLIDGHVSILEEEKIFLPGRSAASHILEEASIFTGEAKRQHGHVKEFLKKKDTSYRREGPLGSRVSIFCFFSRTTAQYSHRPAEDI